MNQAYENNKRRVQMFKLTADVKDDNRVVHHFADGYEYVEIGGIKWATCNVGAEKETDGGLYFAWGETVGYKDANEKRFTWDDYKFGGRGNTLKYINGLDTLKPCDDAASKNMGSNWRVPKRDEFNALLSATTNEWVSDYQNSGINGWLFTDKTDGSKKLFFPAVGLCHNGSVLYVGSCGFYWSNLVDTSDVSNGRLLYFNDVHCYIGVDFSYLGFSVRGVVK